MTDRKAAPLEIPDRTWTVWAIAISLFIALTRLLALRTGALDLLPDEAQYWSWSRTLAAGYFSKPPVVAWLIGATTALLGDDGEFAVRLAAPLIHAATGIVVALLGRDLFSARVGFWAALCYATLPGVDFSALIISTDVPLLFCWALALFALWRLLGQPSRIWAVLLGVAIGLGFLSKYAMGYFLIGMIVLTATEPISMWRGAGRWLLLALFVAVAIVLPNILWNARHGWATVGHTAANADWSAFGLHIQETMAFAAAQFGVFGPILMAAFIVRVALWRRYPPYDQERFLLAFSLPVLLLMIIQSGISRAHANWAAVTYVPATILVVGWLDRIGRDWIVKLSAVLQLALFAAFTILFAGALSVRLPKALDIFHQMRGWRSLAELALGRIDKMPSGTSLAADDRETMAELDYYTRYRTFPLVMAVGAGPAGNQYEAERAIDPQTGAHALLVSRDADRADILDRFAQHQLLEEWTVRAGPGRLRHYYVYELSGYRGG
jgi:4-amino-4-deoxy-L-arabinose transferase-like glycosyltransferase